VAQRGIVFSMGAAAVLVYAVPESPLSQPRNVIAGNVLSCVVGLLFRYVTVANASLRWLAGALSVSCSIVLMQLTKTLHPPAGATALVAATTTDPLFATQGWWLVLTPVAWGFAAMVVLGVIVDNVFSEYPLYWL
jgi:CBS domain-containing membrane protein